MSDAASQTAPDRLLARATGLVIGVGLGVVLAAHAALDRAAEHQARAAELALVGTAEAAAARAVAGALDRIATLPDTSGALARDQLAVAAERLLAGEARRGVLGSGSAGQRETLRGAADAARTIASAPEPGAAARLGSLFRARLLPRLDAVAARDRDEAARARAFSRRVLVGSLALHLLGGAVLVAAVLEPARRRVRAWVARTAEEDRASRQRLLHDPLTGMPNAAYLGAYLARLAAGAERAVTQTAVLRIDLDRFKGLREALGQRTCDEVLRIAARRIQQAMRAGDFAAYLGQDDFVVIATELEDGNDAAAIAGRVQGSLSKPFSIRGGARRITCSIGVTLLSDDQPDPDLALNNAEIALAEAQGAGPGSVRYFRESLRIEVERREALFAELLNGLEHAELVPYFQPQIELASGGFGGFEALVRWQHPRHGLLTPGAFLDLAEQTDLTERIGEVVLTRSLEALRAWDAAGLHVPRVGVNFALAQLRDARLIEKIKWEAERFDVNPGRIAIEVLETVLIKSDEDIVVRNIRGLASAGFHVELDDFGTGHASIANLRRFMVNRIKIDRGFVNGIEDSEEQQTLTASMIAMARALGIGTLAEGVETDAAAETLRRLGCDAFQGFVVARPMSLGESLRWLAGFRGYPPVAEPLDRPAGADPNSP